MSKRWLLGIVLIVMIGMGFFMRQSSAQIVEFSVDAAHVTHADVEQGRATALFRWRVDGLGDGDTLEMHTYVLGEWELVGEGFRADYSETFSIAHPLSYENPRYRLSVVDNLGRRVIEEIIDVPYIEEENGSVIGFFEPFGGHGFQMLRDDLEVGLPIDVHWYIGGRTQYSKPIFEQVLADGSVVTLSDDETVWVRSWEQGYLHPQYEADAREMTLRLRLVDVRTDETLTQLDRVIPIDPISGSIITHHFEVVSETRERGQTAMLHWDVEGVERVHIAQTDLSGSRCKIDRPPMAVYEDLPPSGSLEIDIPEQVFGSLQFVIIADHYMTGKYGCAPINIVGLTYLELVDYATYSDEINYIGVLPTLETTVDDTLQVRWSVNEAEEVENLEIRVRYDHQDISRQKFPELPLEGTLDIPVDDGGEFQITIEFYTVDAKGQLNYLWQDYVEIAYDG